jgi:hypothetical protein
MVNTSPPLLFIYQGVNVNPQFVMRYTSGEGFVNLLDRIAGRDEVDQGIIALLANIVNGAKGDAGAGFPAGGTAGQVLAKNSATDYDTSWIAPPASGSNIHAFTYLGGR